MELAKRFNKGKLRWRNFPMFLFKPVIEVAQFGEEKYDTFNFLKGAPTLDSLDSLKRHLEKFENPFESDLDEESLKNHMAHVAWNALFILYTLENHPELDDRYKPCPQKTETEVNLNILEEKSNNSKSLSSSSDEILAEPKKNWINDMTPEQMRTLQLILEGGKLLMPNPTTALSTPLLSF